MNIINEVLVLDQKTIRKVIICDVGNFNKRYFIEIDGHLSHISAVDYFMMETALDELMASKTAPEPKDESTEKKQILTDYCPRTGLLVVTQDEGDELNERSVFLTLEDVQDINAEAKLHRLANRKDFQ